MDTSPSSRADALRVSGLLFLSFGYVLAVTLLLNCHYLTNDAIGIIQFAQDGSPVAFVGTAFLKLLHLGYFEAPKIGWFAASLYALDALSLFLWLWLISRVFQPWWIAGLLILVVLGYYLPLLIHIDYTATASMLCSAGIAWACLETMGARTTWLRFIGPGLIFMLGYMVRPQVPLGALAYGLPAAVLVILWKSNEASNAVDWRRLITAGLLFFIPVICAVTATAAYEHYGFTPQQKQFEAFNELRGKLQNGIPRATKQAIMRDPKLLATVGWTREDAVHIFNWNFLDERADTLERMQKIYESAPPEAVPLSAFLGAMESRLAVSPTSLLLFSTLPLCFLIAIRRRWPATIGALAILYCIALSSFMSFHFAFSDRTEIPLVTGSCFLMLLVLGKIATAEGHDKPILPALVLLTAVLGGWSIYPMVRDEAGMQAHLAEMRETAEKKLAMLNNGYAGRVLLLQPGIGSRQITNSNPLETPTVRYQPIDLGWSTFSPLFYSQIGKLGIQHGYELVDALVDNPNAYLVGTAGWCYNLLDYVDPARRPHIQTVEILKLPDGSSLYQLRENIRTAVDSGGKSPQ